MKKILLLPVLSLIALSSCGDSTNSYGNSNRTESNSTQIADSEITTKVKASIMTSGDSISASARIVSVNTTNGIVTLSGTVASRDESRKLEKIAMSISGVKKVNNQLTISDSSS